MLSCQVLLEECQAHEMLPLTSWCYMEILKGKCTCSFSFSIPWTVVEHIQLWTTYSCGPHTVVDHIQLWSTYRCGPHTVVVHVRHYFVRDRCAARRSFRPPTLLSSTAEVGIDHIFGCGDLTVAIYHKWYIDDGVVAGLSRDVAWIVTIIKQLEPFLRLFMNGSNCKERHPEFLPT